MGLTGLIHFKVRKRTDPNSFSGTLSIFGYEPKSYILFNEERIGHIIGGKVYFYIAIKHSKEEPENNWCLNYTPELWRCFRDHVQARKYVVENSEDIWNTLDIYHSLKQEQQ